MSCSLSDYPKSPFKFDKEVREILKAELQKVLHDDQFLTEIEAQEKLNSLLEWFCRAPKNTFFRINTLITDADTVTNYIKKNCHPTPSVSIYPDFPELITVSNPWNSTKYGIIMHSVEVIVDATCGAAVMRGAHVFAPGVVGIPHGTKPGDFVSVFADASKKCKKGSTTFNGEKVYLGNGIIKMTREYLFGNITKYPSGIAVKMTELLSGVPILSDTCLPKGFGLLQNVPSIVCIKVLDPQPGETVLDMCAAPGNKTTHIAALMKNQGRIIALEKIKSKIEKLQNNCKDFSVKNVEIFCIDSTKAVAEDLSSVKINPLCPPFPEETFDRILLDGPCSGLGQRPQIFNSISPAELRSYVPLQRKLFSTAVRLLKPSGILVYSTCTITLAENENMVAWALKTHSCLELQSVPDRIESLGLQDAEVKYSVGFPVEDLQSELAKKDFFTWARFSVQTNMQKLLKHSWINIYIFSS
ncbi:putative methyltransferase NSUN6 isoform X2 [Cephus cinctus]|nr:putative methyltransferase NSUN6 isoform X2 [Cephus cinctus]